MSDFKESISKTEKFKWDKDPVCPLCKTNAYTKKLKNGKGSCSNCQKEFVIKESKFEKFINESETFKIEKGLTREEARKLTIKKVKQDHRGFHYNPKTGIATYI